MWRMQQLLNSLWQKHLAPTYILSALQLELANLDSIYTSYKPLIVTATQLLRREPAFDSVSTFNKCTKRSPLPFLGDALSWLTGTTKTKDGRSIKNRVNELIVMQHPQETLVHIISILNVTRYATHVNRQHINLVMEAVDWTYQDVTTLYNITSSLYTHLNNQQIVLHICSILANLRDSLYYMRQVAMHAMENVDTATTGILSPHVLPVDDLLKMLTHIKEALPSTMHLPVSLDDTLHSYRYLCTHVLITDEEFLLLTDVPIQDCTKQLKIYQVFNLIIPHRNISACCDIDTKYLGISYDEMKAVAILEQQFITCQQANRQFCSINTPLQPLSNPPLCIAAIYAKNTAGIEKRCSLQIRNMNSATIPTLIAPNLWILASAPKLVLTGIMLICPDEAPRFIKTQTPIHILHLPPHLPPACSATYQHFHLPLHYESHQLNINISLNTAKLNVMNVSSQEFWIWQHFEDHWNRTQLHHSVNIPSVPLGQLYKYMINNRPIILFVSTDEAIDDTASLWTLFSHTGIYIKAMGSLIPAQLGIFCCYFFGTDLPY